MQKEKVVYLICTGRGCETKGMEKIFLSVIIPTRNRANMLKLALESMAKQNLSQRSFETIVVDNGSTDKTTNVVDSFIGELPNLRFFHEETPGLHVGRHKGLKEAKADILVYADDDIEAFPTWLKGIAESFQDKNVALVEGKTLPNFESEPPDWILDMWCPNGKGHRILGYLSILDLGQKTKAISPQHVFGCNFSIRKSVLLESGGFHPDAFPQKLIRYRGDGESHVSNYIQSKKLVTIYNPKASVYHWVPKMRMTVEYFCCRAYNQGISDSYSAVRRAQGTIPVFNKDVLTSRFKSRINRILEIAREKATVEIPGVIWHKIKECACIGNPQLAVIRKKIALSYKSGHAFHQRMFKEDPKLREWVLRENYMGENGKVPV